jgi:hypothetical protein
MAIPATLHKISQRIFLLMTFSVLLLLVTLIIYHQMSSLNAQNATFNNEPQIPSFFIPQNQERIVAIGDLHGEWNQSIKVMRAAKLIDKDNHWIGGKTIFVQMVKQMATFYILLGRFDG